jgi:hypothetical protein
MKRISLVAALLGAVVLAFAGIASAATGGANPLTNWGGGTAGNGTSVTHYMAAYNDPVFGGVSCTGVHQVKKGGATQDSFTCTSTTGQPLAGGITPGATFTWAPNTWISDYNGVLDTSLTGTISADGMSYTAVATY